MAKTEWHQPTVIATELRKLPPGVTLDIDYDAPINVDPFRPDGILHLTKTDPNVVLPGLLFGFFGEHNGIEVKGEGTTCDEKSLRQGLMYMFAYERRMAETKKIEIDMSDTTLSLICFNHPRKFIDATNQDPVFRWEQQAEGQYFLRPQPSFLPRVQLLSLRHINFDDEPYLRALVPKVSAADMEKLVTMLGDVSPEMKSKASYFLETVFQVNPDAANALKGNNMVSKVIWQFADPQTRKDAEDATKAAENATKAAENATKAAEKAQAEVQERDNLLIQKNAEIELLRNEIANLKGQPA